MQDVGLLQVLVNANVIKDPARAAEKIVLCYGGNPSRLLDVCRLRVTYKNIVGLLGGYDAVSNDAAVSVERVRLLQFDGAPSDSEPSVPFWVILIAL